MNKKELVESLLSSNKKLTINLAQGSLNIIDHQEHYITELNEEETENLAEFLCLHYDAVSPQKTKNIAISINRIKREQIVAWVNEYKDRHYLRVANNIPILVIKDVTYSEFSKLIMDFVLHLECGNFHIIPENFKFHPHEHIMLTTK